VLAAILFVLSEGCTWRGIDAPGACWNSIYQYYRRWCRAGVWEQVWQAVAPKLVSKTVFLDASHIKAHRCALNPAGGREFQALGLTKGGWNTKLHAVVDRRGVPRALFLSAGNVADVYHAQDVLAEALTTSVSRAVADKGYDCDVLRIWLYEQGITPCIPPKSNRRDPLPYGKATYRKRHLVENFFAHLKTFRRVATRYDKLAETFFGWVLLATVVKCGF
jgi:transposase